MHITILGLGLYNFLKKRKLPREIYTLFPILVIMLYGQIVGTTGSSFRAIMMFTLKILADYLGKKYDILTALSLAALLLVIEQPLYIFHTGFLLSFTAILAITVYPVNKKERMTQVSQKIIEPIKISFIIFLFQIPIVFTSFYEYPLATFINTVLVVPVIPVLFSLGCLLIPYYYLGIASGLLPIIIHFIILWINKICEALTNIPGTIWVAGRPDEINIYIYYILLTLGVYLLWRTKKNKLHVPIFVKAIVVCISLLVLTIHPQKGVSITYLSMGQGNCAYINYENKRRYIIDGGSVSNKRAGEYTLEPFLKYMGASVIDGIFLTHLDEDHISAVYDLINDAIEIRIKNIYLSNAVIKDEEFNRLINLCKSKKIKVIYLKQGDIYKSKDLCFRILYPTKDLEAVDRNEYSLVIDVGYKNFKALFTGDVDEKGEKEVVRALPSDYSCNIFMATHHGSKYSNTRELLMSIKPRITIVSCGKGNSYGHPHKEAIERIQNVNSIIYKTMDSGAITISSDGKSMKVNTFN